MFYILGVEYYKHEEVTETNQGNFHEVDGIRVAVFESDNENAIEYAKRFINKLMKAPPEFVKKTFPRFYGISCTKQFWFHVFQKDSLDKRQLPKDEVEVNFDEPTLESNTNNLDESVLDSIDVFIDKDGEEIYNPPERIDFWDTI